MTLNTKEAMMPKLYDTKEVARQLGVTDSRVRQLIADGRLGAVKVGRDWVISEDSLRAYERRKEQEVTDET